MEKIVQLYKYLNGYIQRFDFTPTLRTIWKFIQENVILAFH